MTGRVLAPAVLAVLLAMLLPQAAPAAIVEYPIAASADDTHCSAGSNYVGNGTMNFPYNNDTERRPFLRWSLGVPAGATIESATLKVQASSAGDANPTTIRLWGLDYDSCPPFSTNPYDWPMVADAHVDWALPATFTNGSWYESPDIKTLVQAFIDRPGYAPGKYLGLRGQWQSGRYKYIYQRDTGAAYGAVLQITYSGGNFPPVADAGPDQDVIDADYGGSEPVTLDGRASTDADGTVASWVWTEGATEFATGDNPTVVLSPGRHVLTLTVTDDDGATDADTVVVFVHSIYYVDFDGGDDDASGVAPEAAWKHCPGDPNAPGVPAATTLVGGDQIVFKGGVVYRGSIACNWSGSEGLPIIYDGNTAGTFGTGMAVIDGSEPLGGWTQCTSAAEAGGNTHWQDIWYTYAPAGTTANTSNLYQWDPAAGADRMCWMAQDPNQADPFFMDSAGGFYAIAHENVTTTSLVDPDRLTQTDEHYWDGAYVMVWVQPNLVNARTINSFIPAEHRITYDAIGNPYDDRDERYAIYNHLGLIDTAGEYCFNDGAEADGTHKVWLWPPSGDPNANTVTVSLPSRSMGFHFTGTRSDLTFVGLECRKFAGGLGSYSGAGITNNAHSGSRITVTRCRFEHIRHDYRGGNGYGAVVLSGSDILVSENTFEELPVTNAIQFGGSDSVFRDNTIIKPGRHGLWMTFHNCQILGNTMTDVRGSHADGIAVFNGSSDVRVMYNTILRSNVPICTQASSNVVVAYNHLHCPGGYAYADYDHCTDLKIHHNTLRTGTYRYSLRNDSGGETRNNIYYTQTGSLVPDAGGNLRLDDDHSMDAAVFADPAAEDYRLKAGSPAIDAGLPLGYTRDAAGHAVPAGAAPDIGAFEFGSTSGQSVIAWDAVALHGTAEHPIAMIEGYIEPGFGGLRELRVTFGEALDPATVVAGAAGVAGDAAGDLSSRVGALTLSAGGTVLTITLSAPLAEADWYTITLGPGLRTAGDDPLSGDVDLRLGVLPGDVDGSGEVTSADLAAVRAHAGLAVTGATARWDVDRSGGITGSDMLAVRVFLGSQLP